MNEIASYITAMINMYERTSSMVSTSEVAENLTDLLDFVMDIPDDTVIEISYDSNEGSDGMDQLKINNLN